MLSLGQNKQTLNKMKTKAEFNEYPVTVYRTLNTHWETSHVI